MGVRVRVLDPLTRKVLAIREYLEPQGIVHFGIDRTTSCYPIPAQCRRDDVRYRHCTLYYAGGTFRLDFDRGVNVFVDGRTVAARQLANPFASRDRITLRLGQPGLAPDSRNPIFELERLDPDALSRRRRGPLRRRRVTLDTIDRVARTETTVYTILPWLVTGLAAVALLTIGTALRAAQTPATCPSSVRTEATSAVGLIGVVDDEGRFTGHGTGWLCCGPNPDRLVTNAHVVAQVQRRLSEGGRAEVRFGGDAAANPTVALRTLDETGQHPDYYAFSDWQEATTGGSGQRGFPNVYDVHVIRLDQTIDRPGLRLGRPPPVGTGTLTIGHPLDPANPALPRTPIAFPGSILRSASPFFGSAQQSALPSLLTVRAQSAGGLSGSPVVRCDTGEVGAMVFSGSFVMTGTALEASLGRDRLPTSDLTQALALEGDHTTWIEQGSRVDRTPPEAQWSLEWQGTQRPDPLHALRLLESDLRTCGTFEYQVTRATIAAPWWSALGVLVPVGGRHRRGVTFDVSPGERVAIYARNLSSDLGVTTLRLGEEVVDGIGHAAWPAPFRATEPLSVTVEVPTRDAVQIVVGQAKCPEERP